MKLGRHIPKHEALACIHRKIELSERDQKTAFLQPYSVSVLIIERSRAESMGLRPFFEGDLKVRLPLLMVAGVLFYPKKLIRRARARICLKKIVLINVSKS